MARAVLVLGAVAWSLGSLAAVLVAVVGIERLLELLPPLGVDAEAVRGAVTAVAAGLAVAGVLHVAVVLGLRARRRRAWAAAILLAALLCATFVALAAAAFTSAVAEPSVAPLLLGAGMAASVAAIGYGVVVVRLVGELRAGRPG